jgi:hypothetical protein
VTRSPIDALGVVVDIVEWLWRGCFLRHSMTMWGQRDCHVTRLGLLNFSAHLDYFPDEHISRDSTSVLSYLQGNFKFISSWRHVSSLQLQIWKTLDTHAAELVAHNLVLAYHPFVVYIRSK